ncbi:MAG: biotin--[acetyl-CoA-carboxylase] ligase [Gemmataceae bacterium]|nr:biotin--[acetyl-CoA-carboxylase] ligase [Gemmataceae bacterium]
MSLHVDLLNRLPAETFVRAVEWHDEIGSTSDRAIELATAAKQELPLLVIAGQQTAGRGRGANRWWAAPGALTFSLVLEGTTLGVSADRWPRLSLATALVVGEVIRQLAPKADVQLKWPNDVYIAGRKVCGILLEAPASAPDRIVLGLGLNVNNSLAAAPPEIRDTAIALCDVIGDRPNFYLSSSDIILQSKNGTVPLGTEQPLDLYDVLCRLLIGMDQELKLLSRDNLRLAERWQPYCLLEGRTVTLRQGREEITGICESIDSDGALLLRTAAGTGRFISGTVADF